MLLNYMVREMQRPVYNPITSDFVGKIVGSNIENSNAIKRATYSSLYVPSSLSWTETTEQNLIDSVKLIDSNCYSKTSGLTNGLIPQILLSFNTVDMFERIYGKIPASSLTDKIVWLKNNLNGINCRWIGYGSCPSGSKAYLDIYNPSLPGWAFKSQGLQNSFATTASVPTQVSYQTTGTNAKYKIDDNTGMLHMIAYTDASNGTIASIINTDYASLTLSFLN